MVGSNITSSSWKIANNAKKLRRPITLSSHCSLYFLRHLPLTRTPCTPHIHHQPSWNSLEIEWPKRKESFLSLFFSLSLFLCLFLSSIRLCSLCCTGLMAYWCCGVCAFYHFTFVFYFVFHLQDHLFTIHRILFLWINVFLAVIYVASTFLLAAWFINATDFLH